MKKLVIKNHSVEKLVELLHSKQEYVVGMRLMALIQIAKGKSSRELEDIFDKSHSRYCVWVKNFNKYGLEGLKNLHRSGRKSRLTEKQLKEIKDIVLNKSPDEYGYNTGNWDGLLLIDLICNKYKIKYKKANIYVILKKKLGLSFQKGRGFSPERDEKQRRAFKRDIKKT